MYEYLLICKPFSVTCCTVLCSKRNKIKKHIFKAFEKGWVCFVLGFFEVKLGIIVTSFLLCFYHLHIIMINKGHTFEHLILGI